MNIALEQRTACAAPGNRRRRAPLWLLVLGVSALFSAGNASAIEVNIPDTNLEAKLRAALGIPTGPLLDTDLATLQVLYASFSNIVDLTGLEFCTSLQRLYLGSNDISDLGPLAGLRSLRGLDLESNDISDLGLLAGLNGLTYLNLERNAISDLDPLAGLSSLNILDLGSNDISDLGPLAGLVGLSNLKLERNAISDLGPLAGVSSLNFLDLSSNAISDLAPLAGIYSLYNLYLVANDICDISPLVDSRGLGAGDSISLLGNPLGFAACGTDIPALKARGVEVDASCSGGGSSDCGIEGELPVITQQPVSLSVWYGEDAIFGVTASGTRPLAYRWERNDAPLADSVAYSGTGTASLTVLGCANADEGNYRCRVTNSIGNVVSSAGQLGVKDPIFVREPFDQSAAQFSDVTFEIQAVGSGTLTYQWHKDNAPMTADARRVGVDTPVLRLLNVDDGVVLTDEGTYHCVVYGGDPQPIISRPGKLLISDPAITRQPTPQNVNPGTTVVLQIEAVGTPPLIYRWRKNGVEVRNGGQTSGARTATLTLTNVVEGDGGDYSVIVVGREIVYSNIARLNVGAIPILAGIETDPASGIAPIGGAMIVRIMVASAPAPLNYQWYRDGIPVGTQNPLQLLSMAPANAGTYHCVVSNAIGSVTSPSAAVRVGLTITQQPSPQTAEVGGVAQWSVTQEGGSGALVYQWLFEDDAKTLVPLADDLRFSGASTATLSVSGIVANDAGHYYAQITDAHTTVQSEGAALAVVTELPLASALGLAAVGAAVAMIGAAWNRRR